MSETTTPATTSGSDIGAAGVMFTIDPDSGFENVVVIDGSYGLGEYVVQGKVIPDDVIGDPGR